jgi:dephospho-CoA kinase
MLRLGLIRGGSSVTARNRLLELGAVQADGAAEYWSLDDPGIVLVDLVDVPREVPFQHLAIDVVSADLGERAAEVRAADVTIEGWDTEEQLVAMIDAVWRERIVPFEANLRMKRRAPRRRRPVLAGPSATWANDAARLVDRLHGAIGDLALRIDHIGSTSVPGLRAKDLIDIQVTVRDLDVAAAAVEAARQAGFVHVEGEWFGEDRFGVEHPEKVAVDADPGRATNVNCRPVTTPVWRDALLFRDWLRSRPDERTSYEAMKDGLAAADDAHVDHYSEDKMPWIRAGLARAEIWAADTGWVP